MNGTIHTIKENSENNQGNFKLMIMFAPHPVNNQHAISLVSVTVYISPTSPKQQFQFQQGKPS